MSGDQRIPGALNISYDVLVHGGTQEDHDSALAVVFKLLSDNHLSLNKTKCAFNKSSLKFLGAFSLPPACLQTLRRCKLSAKLRHQKAQVNFAAYSAWSATSPDI